MSNQTKKLFIYWNSLLKSLSNNKILIVDKELRVKTKINVNNLEDFKKFWSLLITPGYVGFSTKEFLEFLLQKDEWNFSVTENKEDLAKLPSKEIFFLLELGEETIKKKPFTLDDLNKLEEVLKKKNKKIIYYVVGSDTNRGAFRFYVLY